MKTIMNNPMFTLFGLACFAFRRKHKLFVNKAAKLVSTMHSWVMTRSLRTRPVAPTQRLVIKR